MTTEPNFFAEDAAYWEAAGKGILLIKLCNACGQFHFYPRGHCPQCGSRDVVWHETSGRGQIYSYTVADIKGRESVMPAIIELEEGIRITALITKTAPHGLEIGQSVQANFVPAKNGTYFLHFHSQQAVQAQALIEGWIKDRQHSLQTLVREESLEAIQHAAVIGAGNMGTTIALALVLNGMATTLVDSDEGKLEQALALIQRKTEEWAEKKKDDSIKQRLHFLTISADMRSVANADLLIESVWEDMSTKKQVLKDIESHVSAQCVIGSNTSTLDLNELGSVLEVPERLIGLHFFNPAHVIELVEIIKTEKSSKNTVSKAKQICQLLKKIPIEVGICHGFAANRMMIARENQARKLLVEGATPHQIDNVLRKFGLPMGPFELQDMTGGIEVNYRRRQATQEKDALIDALYALGRVGKKSGSGFYMYQDAKALPKMDAQLLQLLEKLAVDQGIQRTQLSDEKILQRLMTPLIEEAKALLAEGMVQSTQDIDLIWSLGFGWPKHKVGPMYWSHHLAQPVAAPTAS